MRSPMPDDEGDGHDAEHGAVSGVGQVRLEDDPVAVLHRFEVDKSAHLSAGIHVSFRRDLLEHFRAAVLLRLNYRPEMFQVQGGMDVFICQPGIRCIVTSGFHPQQMKEPFRMSLHNSIRDAVTLSRKVRHVLIGTADAVKRPHIAAAGPLENAADGTVAVAEWFCPGTVLNLEQNGRIVLVVWDPDTDTGYQLSGTLEKMEESAVMNGYEPELEKADPIPQTQRRLTVRIANVFAFSRSPHSDVPIG